MSEGKLAGRVAFVTGAARGIGRAICEAFATEGAAVACADVDAPGARELADAIVAAGGRAEALACDVADSAAVRRAVDEVAQGLGGLHVLVCNAATFTPVAPLHELNEADWQRALDVNLTGAFHVCKHGIPHLTAAGGGSVILLASQMGRVAWPGQATYCTTKGALLQLAKGVALDYAQAGIRCNTLSPGGTATERLERRFGDLATAQRDWGPKHPLGRLGEPAEIARAAVFLAGDESGFMTGADLLVDGGYTAW